jgi:rhamnosyltransferase
MGPAASAIVRVKDEAGTLGATLAALRAQTVVPEIIVVDSGSTDGSLEIARRWCDQLVEIAPREFSYGRALNIGARAASAPVHFALSAHCVPARRDWVERALAHYARADVAGTTGDLELPGRVPLSGPFFQDEAFARAHPRWGFSNHASSWRASVWERFAFDESLDYAEDKEWALRVLAAGWVIAVDPDLWVDLSHQWRSGALVFFHRERRAARAMRRFVALPPYGLRELLREWWFDIPPDHRSALRARLNPVRWAGMIGRYAGQR